MNEKNYSLSVLERELSPNLMSITSSIKGKDRPELLVFKPTFIPDPYDGIYKLRQILLDPKPKPDTSLKIENDRKSLQNDPPEARFPDKIFCEEELIYASSEAKTYPPIRKIEDASNN